MSRLFFGRFLANLRKFSAAGRQGVQGLRLSRNVAFFTGGSTTLAISFFGSKEKPTSLPDGKEQNLELIMREADVFYNNYMIDNAWGVLRRFEGTSNPELLWRLARVLAEKAKITQDKEEKKLLFGEALEFVEKALKNEPESGCFGAHKWYAIIINYVGELEGNKAHIKRSYEMKVHFERALEINPRDATTWHLLGVWHFTFADMSSLQRYAAMAVFGTPPNSTYQEALDKFNHAEMLQPGFYKANLYYLGLCHDRLGNREKAIEYFKMAFKYPIISVDDKEAHEKVLNCLRKLGYDEKKLLNDE